MRTLTYYVAATVDGFIAAPDGDFGFIPQPPDVLDWINAERPETMPTAYRQAMGIDGATNKAFDTVLMGRGTYDPALKHGITSPYAHLRQIVFSRSLATSEIVTDRDPVEVVKELKREEGLGIWLCGGGDLAGQLRDEIDELVIKRYPVVAGAGIPLFRAGFAPQNLTLTGTRTFESGTIVSTYQR